MKSNNKFGWTDSRQSYKNTLTRMYNHMGSRNNSRFERETLKILRHINRNPWVENRFYTKIKKNALSQFEILSDEDTEYISTVCKKTADKLVNTISVNSDFTFLDMINKTIITNFTTCDNHRDPNECANIITKFAQNINIQDLASIFSSFSKPECPYSY